MQRSLFDRLLDRLPDWVSTVGNGVILVLLLGFVTVFGFRYPVADAWQHIAPPIPDGVSRGTQIIEALGVTVTWLAFVGVSGFGAFKAFREAYRELRE